jgi:folate-binding protein YgfZ
MQNNRENTLLNPYDLLTDKFPNAVYENEKFVIFADEQKEYDLIKHSTAIKLNFYNSFIQLDGKDSLDFLHRISTNDIKHLFENQIKQTIFTNEKGRILDKTFVINQKDKIILLGSENNNKVLVSWLNKYIIMEDIKVSDLTNDFVTAEFFGKQAESFLISLCGNTISDAVENIFYTTELLEKKVKFFKSKYNDKIHRFVFLISINDFTELFYNLFELKTVFEFGLIGEKVFDFFRIENKIPKYPNELNDNFNPYETNLIDYVSFTKGCYIGQEVIARLDTYDKVQRVLKKVCFCDKVNLSDDEIPKEILTEDENEAGLITSFFYSELLNKKIGLALVRKKHLEQNLFVEIDNQKFEIKIKD